MTVQTLSESMTQKELCYWMAFHKIEKEEHEERSSRRVEQRGQRPRSTPKQSKTPNHNYSERDRFKDENMLSQLLMMAGKKRKQ